MEILDIESAVFSRVADAFDAAYPNGSRYGELTTSPASFPCLVLHQVDEYFYDPLLPASWVVFDVEAYSNKISGAKQECRGIIRLADETLKSFGSWQLVFCNPFKNADTRVFRMIARYRGVPVLESNEDGAMLYRIYRK